MENLKSVDIRCTEGRNVIVPIRCCTNCICICICVSLYFVFLVPSGIFHLSLNNKGFSGICYLRTQWRFARSWEIWTVIWSLLTIRRILNSSTKRVDWTQLCRGIAMINIKKSCVKGIATMETGKCSGFPIKTGIVRKHITTYIYPKEFMSHFLTKKSKIPLLKSHVTFS